MNHAYVFSQRYQEISREHGMTNKIAISQVMREHASIIDKEKSLGSTIYFTDDSWAVWNGMGWRIKKEEENYENSTDDNAATIVREYTGVEEGD